MENKDTLLERYKASTRRGSAVMIQSNPLEQSGSSPDPVKAELKVENITDAKPISNEEFVNIFRAMQNFSDNNAELLRTLEMEKSPYLFSSAQLIRLLETTDSVKTKLEIISKVSPRLLDPKSKAEELSGLFRFVEDKKRVEDCLKARIHTLNSTIFKRETSLSRINRAGRGGRGIAKRMSFGSDSFDSSNETNVDNDDEEEDSSTRQKVRYRHTSLPTKLKGLFPGVLPEFSKKDGEED